MTSQNRHDRMRHQAMQARRDLQQQTQPQRDPNPQQTPFFPQPVKVNPGIGDITAQRIQSVLGDYEVFQPFVTNQCVALLGISSGMPNTPKLDKSYQKFAPHFDSATKSGGPKNGAFQTVPQKSSSHRSEQSNGSSSQQIASIANVKEEKGRPVKLPSTHDAHKYPKVKTDDGSVKTESLPTNVKLDAKPPDCDKRETVAKRNSNEPVVDVGQVKSKYTHTNAVPKEASNVSTKNVAHGDASSTECKREGVPAPESLSESAVSSKRSNNLSKILIPPQESLDNTTQDVDDIIKEMTATRTPLTGIYTPHKDLKLFPYTRLDDACEKNTKLNEEKPPVIAIVSPVRANVPIKVKEEDHSQESCENEKPKTKKASKKSRHHHKSNKRRRARLSGMSNSETSSSDSDSASDSESSSEEEDETVHRHNNSNHSLQRHNNSNTSLHNHSANTSHGSLTPTAQDKEPSWSLKNFLPDKPEVEKPASDLSNTNNERQSVELFSNDEGDKSASDDDACDLDISDDNVGHNSPIKPVLSPMSPPSHQSGHNLLAVHHRVANKSPRNYTNQLPKSPENTKKGVTSKTESPIAKPITPCKTQTGLLPSPVKHVSSRSPKFHSSSLESTPRKSTVPQNLQSFSSPSAKQRKKFCSLQLSDSSDEGGDEANESDVDVVGVTPDKRNCTGYKRSYKPEPSNSCQKLDFNKSKSPIVDDNKNSITIRKQSPKTPNLTVSLASDKDRDRSHGKHKSKHKSSKARNEKDSSIERIMTSVKTERILSPIHDECGVGSIGSVCYDSDGKATIVVKLNLSFLDHIPLKDTNLNVNLISPDSGVSVSSNAGPLSNTHPGNLDSLDLKDDDKCVDLMDERFDDDKDSVSEDKVPSYNKDCYKKDNKIHEDKERTNENHKIKYRDKEVAEKTHENNNFLSSKAHHKKSSSSKDRDSGGGGGGGDKSDHSQQRSSSKESSRSSKHDETSHRSTESRSKYHKRSRHDSVSSKDSKRSRTSLSSSSSSQKRSATDTTSHGVESSNLVIKPDLSPDQISSDALTCHTTSRAKKPRHEFTPTTADSLNKSQSNGCKAPVIDSPPSNQPVNQNASSNATDKGENWNLDRRRLVSDERLLSADEYLADAKRLKHEADSLSDRLVKSLTYTEAVLCFILCGYAMERDNISEANRIFSMYKDTLRLIMSINSRFRTHSDITGKDRKLTVLSLRIQSLLSLKLFTLKKAEALKLKRVIDDHNKMNGSHSQRAVTAPSPAQAGWTGRSTGTPSPMSPTPSPAGSIGSVGSQGSSAEYTGMTGKLCNGGSHPLTPGSTTSSVMTSPGYVNVPQRIHSVTQQYLSNMHYLIQSHELWDQADLMANDCKEFFKTRDGCVLSLHSDIWQLVQYVRNGLTLLKDS